MTLPLVDRWFERMRVDDDITLLWEPHVIPLMRCNIWHVRGSSRDLVIDTGLGVGDLRGEMQDLLDKPVTAVATHAHGDHIGSHHQFDDTIVHPAEADWLANTEVASLHIETAWGQSTIDGLVAAGYAMDEPNFVTALPPGVTVEGFRQRGTTATRLVDEGDWIDIGSRQFEVLHLPGHSPGSIGLWEASTGTFFSGDVVYDGPLLDQIDGANIPDYVRTMERLLDLPVTVVHAGHDPSFGRDRLRDLVTAYLNARS
ncbi:MAG: MBL fold metallo-hydrolase [Acidimicrobiales bacterium]